MPTARVTDAFAGITVRALPSDGVAGLSAKPIIQFGRGHVHRLAELVLHLVVIQIRHSFEMNDGSVRSIRSLGR
jgi:hypothetical protein